MKSLSVKINSPFKYLLAIMLQVFFCCFAWAQTIPDKPSPARFVNDFAGLLNQQDISSLEQKLVNYQDTTSNQIAIVTIGSLEGYDVESYANELATKWKIGQKDKNNGVLILVASQEHKMRIEVGYGLEGVLPDAATKQVIREVMKPAFKQGNYYLGLDQATDHLIKYASGEYKAEPQKEKKGIGAGWIFIGILLLLFLFSFFSKVNRVRGSHIGNSLSLWTILSLLGNSGRNDRNGGGGWGSGGGSSGGGSSWDFGGGSFGGGGSSGDW